jgi:hypothetical protein
MLKEPAWKETGLELKKNSIVYCSVVVRSDCFRLFVDAGTVVDMTYY